MPRVVRRKTGNPVKRPRAASAAARRFEKTFRPLVEQMVADAIEDRIDALDGLEALHEPGAVAHDAFWKKRGL